MDLAVKFKTTHGPFGAHAKQPWRAGQDFHGLFYGRAKFCCKTVQSSATHRECRIAKPPSVGNSAQQAEKARKKSFLN